MSRGLRDPILRASPPPRLTRDTHAVAFAARSSQEEPGAAGSSDPPVWRPPLRTYMRDAPHGRARCWFFIGEQTKTKIRRVHATLNLRSKGSRGEEWVFITAKQNGRRLIGWVSFPTMRKLLRRAMRRRAERAQWKRQRDAFTRWVRAARRAHAFDGDNWKSFISRKSGRRLDGSREAALIRKGVAVGNAGLIRRGAPPRGSYRDLRVVVGAPVGRVANRKFWWAKVKPKTESYMVSVIPPTGAKDEKICPKEPERGIKRKLAHGDVRREPTNFGAVRKKPKQSGKGSVFLPPRSIMLGTMQLERRDYERLEGKGGGPSAVQARLRRALRSLYTRGEYVWAFLPSHGSGWIRLDHVDLQEDGFTEGPAPQGGKKAGKKKKRKRRRG